MKKIILTTILIPLCLSSFAQYNIKIQVDSKNINFYNDSEQPPIVPENPDIPETILPPIINSFKINGENLAKVYLGENYTLTWSTDNAINYELNGNSVSGNSLSEMANTIGGFTYSLSAFNKNGESDSKSVLLEVMGYPIIQNINAPSNVFINEQFNINWSGEYITKYEISSNNNNSGISTSVSDIGNVNNISVTPLSAGNYSYTVSGLDEYVGENTSSVNVNVENLPSIDTFTVNGLTAISATAGQTLNFSSTGLSSGAQLIGRNNLNTIDQNLPTVAPSVEGIYDYYATAKKTLNSITKYGDLKSVKVTVGNIAIFNNLSHGILTDSYYYNVGGINFSGGNTMGAPASMGNGVYFHYYMFSNKTASINTSTCAGFAIYASNGPIATFSSGTAPNVLGSYSKITLIGIDNSVYTSPLTSNAVNLGNYQYRTANCEINTMKAWYNNPAYIKEIRLHN